jgi:hypothetical protein
MEEFPVVFAYTRAQALADGALVDAGPMAREAGFILPVALTAAAWADCVAWTPDDDARGALGQSERGRLWDVLWMAGHSARVHRDSGRQRVPFALLRVPRGGRRPERVELHLHVGGGDHGEPVATVLLPGES